MTGPTVHGGVPAHEDLVVPQAQFPLIQAGYPPKMLQAILGHASITTTLDLYGHLYPGDMDRYADRLGEAAESADPAKIRPDGTDDEPDES